MRNLFEHAKSHHKNFFNDYLEYLFYDALSKKRVTDYYEKFQTRIPFLNGGLFDPVNFYDWQKTDIVIPNAIFSDKQGDEEGNGILDVFDLYNFTVKEDEPLETEVAIDPEMLGKVFERMLEVKERKSKGAFYTPREIVHYMAQQSLLYYLVSQASSLGISNQDDWKTDLETFIHYGEHIIDKDIAIEAGKLKETANARQIPQSIRDHAAAIDHALENIKICDPAVGSGAFPVGVMNEIVKLRKLLTPFIVPQASSLRTSVPQASSLRNHDESIIIYFDKDAETEIKRRDLPHWRQKGVAYFVTFRLADSIPDSAREEIRAERENWLIQHKIKDKSELQKLPVQARIEYYKLFSKRYDDLLDNGYGSCILAKPDIKLIVEKALKYFDGERYVLDEFVVMPNHVHVIVIPKNDWTLEKITHSWKSFTANEINKLTGQTGQVWMHESFDHIIRSEEQLYRIRQYIEDNLKVSQTSSLSSTSQSQAGSLSNEHQAGSLRNGLTAYAFKSNAIQNSIYGVDIDAGAVEIAKLRLWLSMVVDEERIDAIEPLPNLDYKIVQGNSLINIPDGTAINDALATEIEKLIKSYYYITDKKKKQEQKQIIDKKIQEQLSFVSSFAGYTIDFDFKLFFHEVFHEKNGFDVVIGNPPYVSTKGTNSTDKKSLKKAFGFADDLYSHFFYKSFEILKPFSVLSFITSNTFLTINTKKNVRKLLQKKRIIEIIKTADVFDAMVSPAITTVLNDNANKNYSLIFKDAIGDFNKPEIYQIEINLFRNSINSVFFPPTHFNLKFFHKYNNILNELYNRWWSKIETSKKISQNKSELEQYRNSLNPGDIALLGTITEGGQGLATANNGRFVGVRENTKQAKNILKSRPEKLYKAVTQYKILLEIKNTEEARVYLDKMTETEIWQLFDDLKEKYDRDIFGQGYLYRIVPPELVADVDLLSEDEKKNGIDKSNPYFVKYDKGDKDGNRWYLETPFVIDWSKESVGWLFQNSGKKGQGMPVVRNPQFYFREGFCWTDVNSTYLKCRIKEKGVHDVLSMSLFSLSNKVPEFFIISLINSKFVSEYVDDFINNTSHFQINDARQLPVIIPKADQLQEFKELFDKAISIKKKQFTNKIDNDTAKTELDKIQDILDKMVLKLYDMI